VISDLIVTPYGNRANLVPEVRNTWNAFSTAIPNHPLVNIPTRFECQWPEAFESVAIAVPELATNPANDTGKVVLGRRCLDAAYPPASRNLTLLHESIHLVVQTSTQRQRTQCVTQAREQRLQDYDRICITASPDQEMHARFRMYFGFEFVKMPDELWAELYLRDNYPNLFDERLAHYLRLRDVPAKRTMHTALQPSIRKYYLVSEWFTLELARRIDRDVARLRRFGEIQADWRTDLVGMVGEDDTRLLLDRAAGLLPANVAAIDPAEFDQFSDDIMATPLPN